MFISNTSFSIPDSSESKSKNPLYKARLDSNENQHCNNWKDTFIVDYAKIEWITCCLYTFSSKFCSDAENLDKNSNSSITYCIQEMKISN
jgi:hypothetical protein